MYQETINFYSKDELIQLLNDMDSLQYKTIEDLKIMDQIEEILVEKEVD